MLVLACRVLSSTSFPNDSPPSLSPPPQSQPHSYLPRGDPSNICVSRTTDVSSQTFTRRWRIERATRHFSLSTIGRRRAYDRLERRRCAFRKYHDPCVDLPQLWQLAIRLPVRLNKTRFTLTRICESDTALPYRTRKGESSWLPLELVTGHSNQRIS